MRSKEAVDRLNFIGVGRSQRDRDRRWDFDHFRAEHRTLSSTPGLPEIKKEFIKESVQTDEAVKKTLHTKDLDEPTFLHGFKPY